MKEIGINILSGLLVLLTWHIFNHFFNIERTLDFTEVLAYYVLLCFVIFCLVSLWYNRKRNKLNASLKFDFKFYSEFDNDNLYELYKMFGKNSADDIGEEPNYIKNGSPGYICANEFFSPNRSFMKNFRCRSIRTKQKPGKIFLQLSYLPLDKDSNTLIVQRLPENHSGQTMLGEKPSLALVSFSPIPPRYHANSFNASESYHNEVPIPWGVMQGTKISFEELGAVIRRDSKGAIYFFYVFSARYLNVSFTENVDNCSCLKFLFYENEEAYKNNIAFVKDHDKIIDIAKLSGIKDFVLTGSLPKIGKCPLFSSFWRNLHFTLTLRRAKLKEAEKCILQNLL